MRNSRLLRPLALAAAALAAFSSPLAAQPPEQPAWRTVASMEFDVRADGFSFANYRNRKGRFENDISREDLFRMFGVRPTCDNGTTAANCIVKASARQWIEKMLAAMNIGHCEGIAVASLRFNAAQPFKGRSSPTAFQPRADEVFRLGLDDGVENYIAYYWITQTFEEVIRASDAWAERGPRAIVQEIVRGIKSGTETYTIGLEKYDAGRAFDGHALVPYAVDHNGSTYRVSIYDSNFPGQPRNLFVDDSDAQSWSYSSKGDAVRARADYRGGAATRSLYLTPTSIREDRCFTPEFKRFGEKASNCGLASERASASAAMPPGVRFDTASYLAAQSANDGNAEFFLTGEGAMMVVDPDGRRVGYDPFKDRFVEEIPDAISDILIGGLGIDAPHFVIPYDSDDPEAMYKIVFSGKYLERGTENVMDLVFTAPGFTVGFEGIRLDAGEVLLAEISADGEHITFTSSADGETPTVYFAFDGPADDDASYIATVGGVALAAGRSLNYDLELELGKLFISDDDGNADKYDIELLRIGADGREEVYRADDVAFGRGDRYEMDFGQWKGDGDAICFKQDDEGDGFDDE
ncbi:MAG: hypothetical protein ACK4S4_04290 [Pyrinomonadaceae bacterium]